MTEALDMSRFIEAKSDQLNADDLIGGPRTITVTRVTGCDGDQPISIYYQGDQGKPFKPCKTIRRVLVAVWGRFANEYTGRSMTVYRDDTVQFGGLQVGGIRISHMSHLDKETVVVVAKSKGKKAGMKILPLTADVKNITEAKVDPAERWATSYIGAVEVAADRVSLERFAEDKAERLAQLEAKRPDLHRRCVDALNARREFFAPEGRSDADMGEGFTDDMPQEF